MISERPMTPVIGAVTWVHPEIDAGGLDRRLVRLDRAGVDSNRADLILVDLLRDRVCFQSAA